MPFQSQSQRRKFYHLKSIGKMDQKTIDEWEGKTSGKLPEKKADIIKYAKKSLINKKPRKGHIKLVNSYIKKQKAIKITYQKANGRVVKRKVTPFNLKGNLIIGKDHMRRGTRSFKLERIITMEKAAFWRGFSNANK